MRRYYLIKTRTEETAAGIVATRYEICFSSRIFFKKMLIYLRYPENCSHPSGHAMTQLKQCPRIVETHSQLPVEEHPRLQYQTLCGHRPDPQYS